MNIILGKYVFIINLLYWEIIPKKTEVDMYSGYKTVQEFMWLCFTLRYANKNFDGTLSEYYEKR